MKLGRASTTVLTLVLTESFVDFEAVLQPYCPVWVGKLGIARSRFRAIRLLMNNTQAFFTPYFANA